MQCYVTSVPCRYNIGSFVGKQRELSSECQRFLQCSQCMFFGNLKRVVLEKYSGGQHVEAEPILCNLSLNHQVHLRASQYLAAFHSSF